MSPSSLVEALELTLRPFFEGLVARWEPEQFMNRLRPLSPIGALHEYWLWGGFPNLGSRAESDFARSGWSSTSRLTCTAISVRCPRG